MINHIGTKTDAQIDRAGKNFDKRTTNPNQVSSTRFNCK